MRPSTSVIVATLASANTTSSSSDPLCNVCSAWANMACERGLRSNSLPQPTSTGSANATAADAGGCSLTPASRPTALVQHGHLWQPGQGPPPSRRLPRRSHPDHRHRGYHRLTDPAARRNSASPAYRPRAGRRRSTRIRLGRSHLRLCRTFGGGVRLASAGEDAVAEEVETAASVHLAFGVS